MRRILTSLTGGVAVAAWLLASPAAYAQHHAGGGGHYGGGGHMGGYGGHYGGYGGHYGGYGRYGGYGYYPYGGLGLYLGLGGLGYGYGYYPGYYGAYDGGYYPGYYAGGYNYAPNYYTPGYYGSPVVVAPNAGVQTQSAYTPSTGGAQITVELPANAQLWVDNYKSQQTGPVRVLNTPSDLQPGQTYHYTLKAEWEQNGKPVTQERTVDFMPGQAVTVDFNRPATG